MRHSVVACQTLVDFNPVEEPSWFPEFSQGGADGGGGGGGGGGGVQLLPPRRRTVYDDPDDPRASAPAGLQRRPPHRLTEAGNGVAALGPAAAAVAGTSQRGVRRLTEAGNGVAAPERALRGQLQPQHQPHAQHQPQVAAAPTRQSLGSRSACASPQLSQRSSSDGCPFQDTAPRGADSPRGLASTSLTNLKLPRLAQHGGIQGAGARKGPLGRGLAAARARSPHDSFGSSAETLVGAAGAARKSAAAAGAQQLALAAGGGADAGAAAQQWLSGDSREQLHQQQAAAGSDDVRASGQSQWSNVPLDDTDARASVAQRAACPVEQQ
jgi:hypothetical protein